MGQPLISTRGTAGTSVSLKEAILKSQPADKGLFTFAEFPRVSAEELQAFAGLPYPELAIAIFSKFDFGLDQAQFEAIIRSAYGSQWDTAGIVPLTDLGPNQKLLELFHGPTQAFKDIALQFLPRILAAYRQPGETLRALGASSGDTISAAHFGVGDVEGLQSIFLLPAKGPSEIQNMQAKQHGFPNAITILIDGNFDDGQRVIKEILTNPQHAGWKQEQNFTSFNSINIARILAQVVYYFSAYLDAIRQGIITNGEPLNFSVPSGNFGDALAGVYAQKMGLPIGQINMATNANDVLHRFLTTGKYLPGKNLIQTLAPSQDITVASNFERMVFEVMQDPVRVSQLMGDLNTQGYFEVNPDELTKFRELLTSSTTNDAEITGTIIETYKKTGKVIDPHTATGVHGGKQVFGDNPDIPTVYLATADHIKFDQPAGVPRDEVRYEQVVSKLRDNPPDFLTSAADEASVVKAVQQAVAILNERN